MMIIPAFSGIVPKRVAVAITTAITKPFTSGNDKASVGEQVAHPAGV